MFVNLHEFAYHPEAMECFSLNNENPDYSSDDFNENRNELLPEYSRDNICWMGQASIVSKFPQCFSKAGEFMKQHLLSVQHKRE